MLTMRYALSLSLLQKLLQKHMDLGVHLLKCYGCRVETSLMLTMRYALSLSPLQKVTPKAPGLVLATTDEAT